MDSIAVSGKCAHYGGPLHEGTLRGNTVMCTWHHGCYDVRNGARVEPPALNDLPHYPVRIDNGKVVVTLPQDNETDPQNKAKPAVHANNRDCRRWRRGQCCRGNAAPREIRWQNHLLSAVPELPVDRPNLSKDYLDGHAKAEWMPLREEKWYTQRDIQLRLNTKVTRVDFKAHTLSTR